MEIYITVRKSIENLAGRKLTGGRKIVSRIRRKFEIDRYPNEAIVGPTNIATRRTRGNNIKIAFKSAEFANVVDKGTAKMTRAKILKVLKNPANRDYERRGVVSKGAVIETEGGSAIVVSRPGQDGVVNAVLIKAAKQA